MNPPRKKAFVLSMLLAAAASALAQTAATDAPYLEPCKADVARFCPKVDPKSDEVIGCLKERREEVSDSCKARLAQMRVKPPPAPAKEIAAPAGK